MKSRIILNVFISTIVGVSISSGALAKPKGKKKRKPVTFEQCCEKTDGNTEKCLRLKRVKGKKVKEGKKWVKKSCPAQEPDSQDEEQTQDTDN